MRMKVKTSCPICDGQGKSDQWHRCDSCSGKGWIKQEAELLPFDNGSKDKLYLIKLQ